MAPVEHGDSTTLQSDGDSDGPIRLTNLHATGAECLNAEGITRLWGAFVPLIDLNLLRMSGKLSKRVLRCLLDESL